MKHEHEQAANIQGLITANLPLRSNETVKTSHHIRYELIITDKQLDRNNGKNKLPPLKIIRKSQLTSDLRENCGVTVHAHSHTVNKQTEKSTRKLKLSFKLLIF